MLLPNKHSHPDDTVLAAATLLLRALRRKRVMKYSEARAMLRPDTADFLFIPAVNLLFITGLLDYQNTSDLFEYTGK